MITILRRGVPAAADRSAHGQKRAKTIVSAAASRIAQLQPEHPREEGSCAGGFGHGDPGRETRAPAASGRARFSAAPVIALMFVLLTQRRDLVPTATSIAMALWRRCCAIGYGRVRHRRAARHHRDFDDAGDAVGQAAYAFTGGDAPAYGPPDGDHILPAWFRPSTTDANLQTRCTRSCCSRGSFGIASLTSSLMPCGRRFSSYSTASGSSKGTSTRSPTSGFCSIPLSGCAPLPYGRAAVAGGDWRPVRAVMTGALHPCWSVFPIIRGRERVCVALRSRGMIVCDDLVRDRNPAVGGPAAAR